MKKKKKNSLSYCLNNININVGSQVLAHTLVETGNGPNRPNTIDLLESGLKNWASSDFYNSYWVWVFDRGR